MKNLLTTGNELFIAYGFMKSFDSYKIESLQEAEEKSAELENFKDWLEEREEEVHTVEEANEALYKYYERDDCNGFAKIFNSKEEAEAYLTELKADIEGMIEEGTF